jgi:hypothetical protein
MSEITFQIDRDYVQRCTEKFEVVLDTEDYADYDEMREAAYDLVQEGHIDSYDTEYGDIDHDEFEITDEDYSGDEDEYEWGTNGGTSISTGESGIVW